MLAGFHDVHPVSALLLKHADRWLSASVNGCHQRLLSVSSLLQLKHLDLGVAWNCTQNTPAMPSLESLASYQPIDVSFIAKLSVEAVEEACA